jgi:PAS domain S-box-containing protein
MLDPGGNVASWNSGAELIKGYRSDEILGQHFSRFYTEEDREAHVPDHALETAARDGRVEMEGWRVRKDGSRFWAHVVIEAIHDDQGKLVGYAKVTHDSTEQRQARQVMESFAYSVSHDLRAPLRGIEGFARILLEDYGEKLGAGGRRYAERIVAAADRLQLLISDLLTFSRLQRVEIKLRPLEIERIVRRQQEQAQSQAGPEGAIIEIVEPLAKVCAEASVFEQALSNLLSNAIKYRRAGEPAHVKVWGEQKGDRVRIWVEDQGIGIAPEHHDRIFGAFERLHGQENYPGSGMGLAIVKTGVERMGGAVGLVSKLGEGSKFWIELLSGDRGCAET